MKLDNNLNPETDFRFRQSAVYFSNNLLVTGNISYTSGDNGKEISKPCFN